MIFGVMGRLGKVFSGVPIPICGLAVAMASLDRYLSQSYDEYVNIFAVMSAILIILFSMRMITDFKGIRKDLESPILFGVFPIYFMTVIVLSTHVNGFSEAIASILWLSALIMCFAMMPLFVHRFILKFDIRNVFPSWFVMFIGHLVGSVTSVTMGYEEIGRLLFWFGMIAYVILLPLILYRVVKVKGIPEPAVPNIAIIAAPPNLLLVGYLTSFGSSANDAVVGMLTAFGIVSYVAVLAYMPFMMKRKFYPSYAAFTFPLAISMVSMSMIESFYGLQDGLFGVFQTLSVVIAIAVVLYVLVRYIIFLSGSMRPKAAVQ
jgi:Tellurite resistance protein and related permeases